MRQFAATSPHYQLALAISPDSRWIATQRTVAGTTDFEVFAIRLPDLKEFRTRVPSVGESFRIITWSDDSEHLLIDSRLMRIDLDRGPHDLNPTELSNINMNLRHFVGDRLLLGLTDLHTAGVYSLDGGQIARFGFPMWMRSVHDDGTQARRQLGSFIPIIAAAFSVQSATALGVVDTSVPGVRWMGIAFDDGATITYEPPAPS